MNQKNHYENLPIYKATYQLVLAFQVHSMPHLSRDVLHHRARTGETADEYDSDYL